MRTASIGNGRILANYDEWGRLVDLYYPYVGMENQTAGFPQLEYYNAGSPKELSELGPTIAFSPESNSVILEFKLVDLTITRTDFTDVYEPVLFRIFKIVNKSSSEVDLSFSHLMDVNFYSNRVGDSAFYDPDLRALVSYKSRRYMAVKVSCPGDCGVNYAVGKGDVEADAKDGKVDFKPVDNGDIFLAFSVSTRVKPSSAVKVYVSYAFGKDYKEVMNALNNVSPMRVELSFSTSANFWKAWINRGRVKDGKYDFLYKASLLVMRSHLDERGAIIASSDYSYTSLWGDYYNYCWPRDSAIIAHALDMAGYGNLALKHFRILPKLVSEQGFLYQKYNPDLTLASSWHPRYMDGKPSLPIQEDETALELWAIGEHYKLYNDLDELTDVYRGFVYKAVKFLMSYVEEGLPKPSWDLWEERYGVHIWTVSAIYAGLGSIRQLVYDMGDSSLASDIDLFLPVLRSTALSRLVKDGRFVRMLDKDYKPDMVVDSSMLAPALFGLVSPADPVMVKTAEAVEKTLTVNGGLIRYENDMYRREKVQPNPWIITTLWLAQYKAMLGNRQEAIKYLDWVTSRATKTGLLPEQVDPETLQSTNVIPLAWSHAEFIITLKKLRII